jgi:hypothetical protein
MRMALGTHACPVVLDYWALWGTLWVVGKRWRSRAVHPSSRTGAARPGLDDEASVAERVANPFCLLTRCFSLL